MTSTTRSGNLLILGATGGLGLALARKAAEAGLRLRLHGRNQERLERLGHELRTSYGIAEPEYSCVDLDRPKAMEAILPAVEACDYLAIARGAFVHKTLRQTGWQDWQLAVQSNLSLPGYLASRAAAAMADRGFGRILLFGGTRTDAIRGYKHNAAYAAAKTGLAVLTKSLATEFAQAGVACAMICPGFVDTEYLPADWRPKLAALSPRGRLIEPEAIGELAIRLLCGDLSLVNGAIINADQGLYSF